MNARLTPELERLIQEKVASGLYNDQSEVVREALRLLVEQDQVREAHLEHFRSALAEGLAKAEHGGLLDGGTIVEDMRDLLRSCGKPGKKLD